MWNGKSVSVILPTYNEKDSIRAAINEFAATGVVDEILAINNNAAAGTSDEIRTTVAREIHEPTQGYGHAIQRGLSEASGEYLVVCEPDATFLPVDIFKLLAYAHDFEIVYGSRTSQQLIWTGANMGWFLKWGNWTVAKYLEFLFNATNLTDVGCTYRLLRRQAWERLRGSFNIGGNAFGPEMMIRSFQRDLKTIQIPVNYMPRIGESSVTGDPVKAVRLGLWMIRLITVERFRPSHKARP